MRKWRVTLLVCVVCLDLAGAARAQHADFSVGTIIAPAGTRVSGFLEVLKGVDAGTRIPVTVIHGSKPGPVLALVAGTHGYEYSPILALQRFPAKTDPRELVGTIIMVHIANMPSFLGRTTYYSPVDGENLNRVCPGKTDGTVSERIAATLTREVIDRADYLVDLHCGDGNEVLRSPATGIFHARVQPDQSVARGTLLGVLTDFFRNTLQEIRAPFSGIVLYVVATPPVSQGEPLGMIGHIKPE